MVMVVTNEQRAKLAAMLADAEQKAGEAYDLAQRAANDANALQRELWLVSEALRCWGVIPGDAVAAALRDAQED